MASDAFGALFTFQTATLVPAARLGARGFATLLHSPRIEGWAERRETFGCSAEHPLGLHMTRQAKRLRGASRPIARQDARERAYDAGRSPLGAPPWLPSPLIPAQAGIQELGPRFRGDERKEAYATPRSAFRIVS